MKVRWQLKSSLTIWARQRRNSEVEARTKVLLGTAKALAYLHEAIEPKVVHRDIKSNNILIEDDFSSKVSDFGLAKLLGAGESHITTCVMGTFGSVYSYYYCFNVYSEP